MTCHSYLAQHKCTCIILVVYNINVCSRLSMVTANGVPAVNRPNLRTTYRKMADIGVQYEPQDTVEMSLINDYEPEVVSSTVAVAEINTSAEPSDLPSHRPLSMQVATCGPFDTPINSRPKFIISLVNTSFNYWNSWCSPIIVL